MGHRPVGVFWVVKDGKKELLQSLMDTPDMLNKTYSDKKKWIDDPTKHGIKVRYSGRIPHKLFLNEDLP